MLAALLPAMPLSSAGERSRYVPFLDKRVPVAQLEEKVFVTMDANRRDYAINDVRLEFGLKGAGVEVCVIDTGVDATHEQLDNGKVVAFADFTGTASVAPIDDHGHGTHVSSIVAGDGLGPSKKLAKRYRGVAPLASISSAKVLGYNGSGSIADVIEGVEWCAQRPTVDIINMSLGTKEQSTGTDPLSQAVDLAVGQYGKIVVVSAGNSGNKPGDIGSPGAAGQPISVAASSDWSAKPGTPNYSGGPFLTPWSSRGPTVSGLAKPDITAPGHTVMAASSNGGRSLPLTATPGGYHSWSGTSMSSPFIAGVAALMLEANPSLTNRDIKTVLATTALDLGYEGWDGDWGNGLVNPYSAIAQVKGVPGKDIFPTHAHYEGGYGAVGGSWYWTLKLGNDHEGDPLSATFIGTGFDATLREWANGGNRGPQIVDISACGNDYPCGSGAYSQTEVLAFTTGTVPSSVEHRNYTIDAIPPIYWGVGPSTDPVTFVVDVFWGGGEWTFG
jgi:serine protease AprX